MFPSLMSKYTPFVLLDVATSGMYVLGHFLGWILFNNPAVFLLGLSLLARPTNNERRLIRGNESDNDLTCDLVWGLGADAGVERRPDDEE